MISMGFYVAADTTVTLLRREALIPSMGRIWEGAHKERGLYRKGRFHPRQQRHFREGSENR